MCYRVNFTATSDLQLERTLFFAEFLFSGGPRPETCCPLPYEYAGKPPLVSLRHVRLIGFLLSCVVLVVSLNHAWSGFILLIGRCYSGVHTARKIVYPDDAKYIPHDITHDGTCRVDDMLEMDVVHFSSEMDVELAEKLNKMHTEE